MKKIIFDTDIGCDCDDVGALCLLLSAEHRGECELAAVTLSSPYETAPACTAAILEQYGRADIPIGSLCKPFPGYYQNGDVYSSGVAQAFQNNGKAVSDSVTIIRAALAGSADRMTLLATGPLPNINAFLMSKPDDISPLDGVALAMLKLDGIVIMGGWFEQCETDAPQPEFNIVMDIESAAGVLARSPVPVTALPFEVGLRVLTGGEMVKKYGRKKPSSLSYILHKSEDGRDSWDPAAAFYCIYGCKNLLKLSAPGTITINKDNMTQFIPREDGKHYYLRRIASREELAVQIDRAIRL